MKTPINPLKQMLADGSPAIGTFVSMPSPQLVQVMSVAGFDWLTIDMEHGPIGPESMHAMINATAVSHTVPLVRVPATDPWMVKKALDAGALGVFFPLVVSAEQARSAVSAMRYPPTGTRGFAPFFAPSRWRQSTFDYAAAADDNLLTIVLIEQAEAVRNIDEILAVDGIDVAFIAPFDLSQSLGIPGEFDHPKFLEAVTTAENAILASPAALGGLAMDVEKGRAMVDRGYTLLMMAYDGLIIETASRDLIEGMRS